MVLIEDGHGGVVAVPTRLRHRIAAHLFAGRIDAGLARGKSPDADAPSALRARALTGRRQRRALAHGFELAVRRARRSGSSVHSVPMNRAAIDGVGSDIDELCARLLDAGPVSPAGVARARSLLTDGCGPLYGRGRSASVQLQIRGAIDALNLSQAAKSL